MSISDPFIRRPIATVLLSAAVLLAGGAAYKMLPVAPLPRVDFPTINVSASEEICRARFVAKSMVRSPAFTRETPGESIAC